MAVMSVFKFHFPDVFMWDHTFQSYLKTHTVYNYLLDKKDYALSRVCLFVYLSVCLSISTITKKVMNRLKWNLKKGSGVERAIITREQTFGSNPDQGLCE